MNIFDAMSDRTVNLFGIAFCIALRNWTFQNRVFAVGIVTDDEILRFIRDMKELKPAHVTRRWLNKFVTSVEEYDKRNATADTVNAIQERIDFVGNILEENHEQPK